MNYFNWPNLASKGAQGCQQIIIEELTNIDFLSSHVKESESNLLTMLFNCKHILGLVSLVDTFESSFGDHVTNGSI